MRSLILFYIAIMLPLPGLIVLYKMGVITSTFFIVAISFYFLIYHPAVCGIRLLAAKKISRKQFLFNFIPGWNRRYFNFLFFNK